MSELQTPLCHQPVLLDEVLAGMRWNQTIDCIVDLTVGGGGHLYQLLSVSPRPKRIIAVDRDSYALSRARERLKSFEPIEWVHDNFSQFQNYIDQPVSRLFLDIGVSSFQLDDPSRGFSFRQDGPLDMRMDQDRGDPAWRWLESVREEELAKVIWQFGEERRSRVFARRFVSERKKKSIRSTKEFVEAMGYRMDSKTPQGVHPLTKVFQAIRIFINDELESLDSVIAQIPECLEIGGRVSIITFHSLEDRQVKWGLKGKLAALNKKVIQASEGEKRANPRARSAKLRMYEKRVGEE